MSLTRAKLKKRIRIFQKTTEGATSPMNNHHATLPVNSFSRLWARGEFDDVDYYALTAPLDEWSASYGYNFLAEPAPGVCETGWGIVTWKLAAYVYSSKAKAGRRARLLGGNVRPIKLKCLACFARAFSTSFTYVDMILDESWHIKTYICRELAIAPPGVSHLRLSAPDGIFQLQGCEANNDLEWAQYPSYSEPNQPEEWCRPVPFPGQMVMYDHTPQGGPIDMEFLQDPHTLAYYNVDGVEIAIDATGTGEAIFTRPTGPVAFANLMHEQVRLTSGEGVWIPIGVIEGKFAIRPWAREYKPYIDKILAGEIEPTPFHRGCKWYINNAITLLEQKYLENNTAEDDSENTEDDEETRVKARQEAIGLLEKAVEAKPWDWYAKTLLRDLKAFTPAEVPAIIHADRCAWLAGMGLTKQLEDEYHAAMNARPHYHLAIYTRAMVHRVAGDMEAYAKSLEKLLKTHPKHPQALFDLGVASYTREDEKAELKYYARAIKADPTYAPPYYNTGKTHEDNGKTALAREYYEKALQQNPYYVEAAENLAIIRWSEGDYGEAINLLLRNIYAEPRRPQTYQGLIQIAEALQEEELLSITMQALQKNLPRLAAGKTK